MNKCLRPTKTTWLVLLTFIVLVLLMIVSTYADINSNMIGEGGDPKGFWTNVMIFASFAFIVAPAYFLDDFLGTLRSDSVMPIPNTFGFVVDIVVWLLVLYCASIFFTWVFCKFKEMYEE